MTLTEEFVSLLDRIDVGDPEDAHWVADHVLLNAVDPEIREAYERVKDRCRWWAYA